MDEPDNRKEVPDPAALRAGTTDRNRKEHPEKGGAIALAFADPHYRKEY